MFGDKKDYNFFIVVLVSAIVISLIFHMFFRQNVEASFSEVYFPYPDSLPNEVNLGQKYNFTFVIWNHEEKPTTYNYESKLELFNIYDITEGLYKCIARQRKKVPVKWVEENQSNNSIYLIKEINTTSFFYSAVDDYGRIEWPNYNVEFHYKNPLERGSFTIVFEDENKIKYSFTIFHDTSEVELAYLNSPKAVSERKRLEEFRPDNKIKINATENLKFYFNDELIFDKKIGNLTNGKLGFRMDNGIGLVSGLIAYKESPIEVTQSKYVKDFEFDNRKLLNKLSEFKEEAEDEYFLNEKQYNLSTICQDDSCKELKSFLNSPGNRNKVNFDYQFNNAAELLDLIETGSSILPTYSIIQNTTANELFWPNYSLRINFQTFVKPHAFIVSFDNEFMLLFHDENMYFISNENGNLKIDRRISLIEIGLNELLIISNNLNNVVYVNSIPIYNIKKAVSFKDISFHAKNTFVIFDDFVLSNKDKKCKSSDESKECKRVYNVFSRRELTSERREVRASATPIEITTKLAAAPILGVSELFNFEIVEKANDSEAGAPSLQISRLADYDIFVDPGLVNENIPSESYVFDGGDARLENKNNYTFSFRFYILEGAGLLEASFHNTEDAKIMTILLDKSKNEAHLFKFFQGSLVKDTLYANLSADSLHQIEVLFEANNTIINLDRRRINDFEGIDMSNGYFSISTYNTYAEIREITLFDKSINLRIPFNIAADPCRLRKIDETQIEKDSLYLDNEENKTIRNKFSVNSDFDYGMVSVTLQPELGNQSEIHFWVINND